MESIWPEYQVQLFEVSLKRVAPVLFLHFEIELTILQWSESWRPLLLENCFVSLPPGYFPQMLKVFASRYRGHSLVVAVYIAMWVQVKMYEHSDYSCLFSCLFSCLSLRVQAQHPLGCPKRWSADQMTLGKPEWPRLQEVA